ncbi:MAG TPA: septum formation initiator family protein [Verrucomicrobiae bacterium]|jgi:cell division protein FtsB|nr:septum formation initiator family protein [Verrucomicrobiae bacterium]
MAPRLRLSERWPMVLFGALLALISLVTLVGERGALHLWRLRGEKQQLDEQNFRLQRENEMLRQRIARIRSDDRYLEKLAREELNLVRPSEVVYRFPPSDGRGARRGAASEAPFESPPSKEQKSRR